MTIAQNESQCFWLKQNKKQCYCQVIFYENPPFNTVEVGLK